METKASYGQFCPVAMAAEIFCTRWTPLILRELLAGSTRFNDLRRGVPKISPTLLSKRLKEMELAGVVASHPAAGGATDYRLMTPAGHDLGDLVMRLGFWGQAWVDTQKSLKNLDPSLLMWDMRRNLDPSPIPPRRCTIQFRYPELSQGRQDWWLVVERRDVDLCKVDPGFDVDLYVESSLRTMTSIWMGLAQVKAEIESGRLDLSGDPEIAKSMQKWLGLSPFARGERKVA